jgi:hypothetical protein
MLMRIKRMLFSLQLSLKFQVHGSVHRITIYISNQLDVTFSFFTLFLQLYMFRAFLAHIQELICCIGSYWLDK